MSDPSQPHPETAAYLNKDLDPSQQILSLQAQNQVVVTTSTAARDNSNSTVSGATNRIKKAYRKFTNTGSKSGRSRSQGPLTRNFNALQGGKSGEDGEYTLGPGQPGSGDYLNDPHAHNQTNSHGGYSQHAQHPQHPGAHGHTPQTQTGYHGHVHLGTHGMPNTPTGSFSAYNPADPLSHGQASPGFGPDSIAYHHQKSNQSSSQLFSSHLSSPGAEVNNSSNPSEPYEGGNSASKKFRSHNNNSKSSSVEVPQNMENSSIKGDFGGRGRRHDLAGPGIASPIIHHELVNLKNSSIVLSRTQFF